MRNSQQYRIGTHFIVLSGTNYCRPRKLCQLSGITSRQWRTIRPLHFDMLLKRLSFPPAKTLAFKCTGTKLILTNYSCTIDNFATRFKLTPHPIKNVHTPYSQGILQLVQDKTIDYIRVCIIYDKTKRFIIKSEIMENILSMIITMCCVFEEGGFPVHKDPPYAHGH